MQQDNAVPASESPAAPLESSTPSTQKGASKQAAQIKDDGTAKKSTPDILSRLEDDEL